MAKRSIRPQYLVIEGAGAFRLTAADLLKYVFAKLDGAIQLQHLLRHPDINANPMNHSQFI